MRIYTSPLIWMMTIDAEDIIVTSSQEILQNGGINDEKDWGGLITPK